MACLYAMRLDAPLLSVLTNLTPSLAPPLAEQVRDIWSKEVMQVAEGTIDRFEPVRGTDVGGL
jgi:hypothetical protein